MAMRSSLAGIPHLARSLPRISRCFSDGKGKVLSEEERAAENIYIKKMERERFENMKLKAEKEKAAAAKLGNMHKLAVGNLHFDFDSTVEVIVVGLECMELFMNFTESSSENVTLPEILRFVINRMNPTKADNAVTDHRLLEAFKE